MSAYLAEDGVKEMSIRKRLNAAVPILISTPSLDFIKPVVVAILITIPLTMAAYRKMPANTWLPDEYFA